MRLPLGTRGPGSRWIRSAVCFTTLLLTAGCGTTVNLGRTAGAGSSPSGLGSPAAGGEQGSSTTLATTAGAQSGGALGGQAATTAAPGANNSGPGTSASGAPAAGGTATSPSATPVPGRAVPATGPVEIGFLVTKCSNCDALGNAYVAPTHSEQDVLQALVTDLNHHGGIAGHQIVPVWGVEDTASTDWNTMMQSVCATFTQDHHVLAVLGAGFIYSDILATCLAKAGVVTIDAMRATGVPDQEQLAAHPDYILSQEPALESYELVAYTSAVSDGWLTPRSKLGVVSDSCPVTQQVWQHTIEPYLASQHIPVTVNYVASCGSGAADASQAASQLQEAELKMRSNGVDTVAVTDIPLILFAEGAESQHWYPKYLATEGAAGYESFVPSDQLRDIHSAGWEPSFDLDSAHQLPLSQQQRDCLAALGRGGLSGATSSEYTMYFGLCGSVEMYTKAVASAGSLASANVLRAIDALSSSFVSPITLGGQTLFGPTKHDAAVSYRSETYNSGCSCFQYIGPVRQLPAGD